VTYDASCPLRRAPSGHSPTETLKSDAILVTTSYPEGSRAWRPSPHDRRIPHADSPGGRMICTVTLNTSIDKAYRLESPLVDGTVQRVATCIDSAGGKVCSVKRI